MGGRDSPGRLPTALDKTVPSNVIPCAVCAYSLLAMLLLSSQRIIDVATTATDEPKLLRFSKSRNASSSFNIEGVRCS